MRWDGKQLFADKRTARRTNPQFAHPVVFLFTLHADKSRAATRPFGGIFGKVAVSANIGKKSAFADVLRKAAQETASRLALLAPCRDI